MAKKNPNNKEKLSKSTTAKKTVAVKKSSAKKSVVSKKTTAKTKASKKVATKKVTVKKKPLKVADKVIKDKIKTVVDNIPIMQEETKFIMTPQKDTLAPHEISRLPNRYYDNRLVLLVRDPWWMHVYWDLSEDRIREVVNNVPGDERNSLSRVIRVYNVSGFKGTDLNKNKDYFDVQVNDHACSWYINTNNPDAVFCVEFGFKSSDSGEFYSVARSNNSSAQHYGISDQIDEEWMTLSDEQYAKVLGLGSFDVRAGQNGVFGGNSSETFQQELKERLKGLISSAGVSSEQFQWNVSSEQFMGASEQFMGASEQFMGASEQFMGASEQFMSGLQQVSPESLLSGVSSEQFMGSSEQVSSPEFAMKKAVSGRQRKFFLEVYTDVIVYGRTEPDAAVTFCGEPITLNPDGTFRFRYHMPIGDYNFPVQAVSADEIDTITIEPMVTRRTRDNKPYRIDTEGFDKKSV